MPLALTLGARRSRTAAPAWAVIVLALLAAAFIGAVVALGVKQLDLLLIGAFGGVVLLFAPIAWVFWGLLALTFLVVGQLQYFAKINQAQWVPYLIALTLFLRIPIDLFRLRGERAAGTGTQSLSPVVWATFAYFTAVVASALLNNPPFLQLLAASKNYFFLWSIMLLLALAGLPERQLATMWKGVTLLVLVQFPLAVYQHFFVAASRTGSAARAAWDAVVGSFGGDPLGGGSSGALALFLVVAMVIVATWWKDGLTSTRRAGAIASVALCTILLAEVKIVYVLLPIAFLLVFWREIYRRPVMFIATGCVVVTMFLATAFAYHALYSGATPGRKTDLFTSLEEAVRHNTDTRMVWTETGEMGRAGAIGYWWDNHRGADAVYVALGHGPGASRSSGIGAGEMAIRHRLAIDRSSLTVLLWDVGVVGLLAFLGVLAAGARGARRLAKDPRIPPLHASVLRAAPPILALYVVTLPYNTDVMTTPAMQVLLMLVLGQVVYWHRTLQRLHGKGC